MFNEKPITTDNIDNEKKNSEEKLPNFSLPKDKYSACRVLFFLLGICMFLPITFFAAANNFWFYKFRNITDPTNSAENRTKLQINYSTVNLIVSTVCNLMFGIFNVTLAHRIKILHRIFVGLIIETCIFFIYTISVEINTDNAQLLYFIFVIASYGVLSATNTVVLIAGSNYFTRFPSEYMYLCQYGQGSAGLIGNLLNIFSISVFQNDIEKATLLYFIIGSVIFVITVILFSIERRSEFFHYYSNSVREATDKKWHTLKEIKDVTYKIRLPLSMLSLFMINITTTSASVMPLVVSELDDTDSVWAKTYFNPVLTYLLANFCALIGRIVGVGVKNIFSEKAIFGVVILDLLIVVPFIWLCNAQPRHHLPLLFPHDYQYGIQTAVHGFFNGFILLYALELIKRKTDKTNADLAFTLFGFFMNTIEILISPLGIFLVNFL
ncbi:hypothetical protein ABEB36_004306 [Hypothenemus hampei]|uniref:Equilibrative nucleoside transporter 3 n=1 Tax=Hypothenemus hampei TaxID=57062 RepID=A0ABD1F2W8_HYPHA